MFGEFCRLLQKCARRTDVIGRYGGDEFVVLMPESGLMPTRAFPDRVLETIRGRIFCFGTHDIRLSVSIGASISDNVCKPQCIVQMPEQPGRALGAENIGLPPF